jgi:ribose transport system substrate-binding protein
MSVKRNRKPAAKSDRYRVGTLEKGLILLERLEKSRRPLSVAEIAAATGFERTGVFRLLSTLEERGYVARREDRRYTCLQWHRTLKVAYLAPLSGNPLRCDLLGGVERAADRPHIELTVFDNAVDDAEAAERNALRLARSGADVAVFFEPDAAIAHLLASRLAGMGLPHLTVCSPVEGVVYLGPNNYHCGKLAGHTLGLHVLSHWKGEVDWLIALEPAQMGAESLARVAGMEFACAAVLGRRPRFRVIHTPTRRYREEARELVAGLLRELPPAARIALATFNDPTALGALDAFRAAGREDRVAALSHSGTEEARAELARPRTSLIASIGYFPERWGEPIMRLAAAMAARQAVEPASSVETAVLRRDNLKLYYPGA